MASSASLAIAKRGGFSGGVRGRDRGQADSMCRMMFDTPAHSGTDPATPALSLLDVLSGPVRADLLALARPVTFADGAVLLRQGQPTRGAYLLSAGTVEVSVRLPGGEALAVARIPAGGVLGEMALLERGTCSATVTACSAVAGMFIPCDEFRLLVARHSPAALALQHAVTTTLCAKLTALNGRLLAVPVPEDLPYAAPPASAEVAAVGANAADVGFDYRAFLPVLPLFAAWAPADIEQLLAHTRPQSVARGQVLFYEGAPAAACFITLRGAVEITAVTAYADRDGAVAPCLRRLAILGPGQLLGYRGVLDGVPHSVRACAREASVLLVLPRPAFLALYHGSSAASLGLRAAVHAALLQAMTRTNATLTRLVNLARLAAARQDQLESALIEQVVYAS